MVMRITRAVATIIQAVSPLLGTGGGAAASAAGASGAASALATAASAATAGLASSTGAVTAAVPGAVVATLAGAVSCATAGNHAPRPRTAAISSVEKVRFMSRSPLVFCAGNKVK